MERSLHASPILSALLNALRSPPVDAWLAVGTVTQTYWNDAHGFPPNTGARNIDFIFHDAETCHRSSRRDWRYRSSR